MDDFDQFLGASLAPFHTLQSVGKIPKSQILVPSLRTPAVEAFGFTAGQVARSFDNIMSSVPLRGILLSHHLCSHQESNLDRLLRREIFYPLNYGSTHGERVNFNFTFPAKGGCASGAGGRYSLPDTPSA